MNSFKSVASLPAFMALGTSSAQAAVSAAEAKQLGGSVFSAFGAERAGNQEATIPVCTGTGPKVPPSWYTKIPG